MPSIIQSASSKFREGVDSGAGYGSDVVLLMHHNGTDPVWTDDSSYAHSFTPVNAPTQTTAQRRFGKKSTFFRGYGAGDDTLILPGGSAAALDFGALEFTLEMWLWFDPSPAVFNGVFDKYTTSTGYTFRVDQLRRPSFYAFRAGGLSVFSITGANALVKNQDWSHVCVMRRDIGGGLHRCEVYADGELAGSQTNDSSYAINSDGLPVTIGRQMYPLDLTRYFRGYIDEIRVTKGRCVYAGRHTPPKVSWKNPD